MLVIPAVANVYVKRGYSKTTRNYNTTITVTTSEGEKIQLVLIYENTPSDPPSMLHELI